MLLHYEKGGGPDLLEVYLGTAPGRGTMLPQWMADNRSNDAFSLDYARGPLSVIVTEQVIPDEDPIHYCPTILGSPQLTARYHMFIFQVFPMLGKRRLILRTITQGHKMHEAFQDGSSSQPPTR